MYLFNQRTVFIGICKNCNLHSKKDLKLEPESKAISKNINAVNHVY